MKRFIRLEEHWQPRIEDYARSICRANELQTDTNVMELSHGLTRERELAHVNYMQKPEYLAAYLQFFWPNTYVQAHSVLRQIDGPLGDALDLGCGCGATAAALEDLGATSIDAVDISPDAVKATEDLVETATGRIGDLTSLRLEKTYTTIVLGYVLNELWIGRDDAIERRADLVSKCMEHLKPGGRVVVLEPATRRRCTETLEMRDILVDRGIEIAAPCLKSMKCPALADDDWCHAAYYWRPYPSLEARSQRVGLRRDVARCTYFIFENEKRDRTQLDRVISSPLHTKGRLRYLVCGTRGRHHLVLLERNVAPHNEVFQKLYRGTVFTHGPTETKGDGWRLLKDSEVRKVAEPDEPVSDDSQI